MRALWMVAILAVVALAGCFSSPASEDPDRPDPVDVGFDPESVEVTGVRKDSFSVTSFDGVTLSTVAYVPQTSTTLPDGSTPEWPVIIFLHGLGFFKEQYEGFEAVAPGANPDRPEMPEELRSESPEEFKNILNRFAEAGFIAVAYDTRGHGQSTGSMGIAGIADLADLDHVIDYVESHYDASGRVGISGVSYGAGIALQAIASNPKVDTVVPMFGWLDLYDALMPNNVPKLQWMHFLGAMAAASNRGAPNPAITSWYEAAISRADMDTVEAQMDARSTRDSLGATNKPIFACQGMQETLFPQVDEIAAAHGGYTRTYIYTGGHNLIDAGCLERALGWFQFFLAGIDSGVGDWPELETQDVSGERFVPYQTWPETQHTTWYLREPDLASAPSPDLSFTIQQQFASNPFSDPSVISDALGTGQELPEQFRQDPTATFFESPSFSESAVLVGAPVAKLHLADVNQTGWQITGQLLLEFDGRSQIISRGAYAALDESDLDNGTIEMRFHFTKANIQPGASLVLKLSSNDPSWWMPFPDNYAVTFTGESSLAIPVFSG